MAQGLTVGKKSKDFWPTAFSIHGAAADPQNHI